MRNVGSVKSADHNDGVRCNFSDHNASIRGVSADHNATLASRQPLEQARRFYEAVGNIELRPADRVRLVAGARSHLIMAAERGECDGSVAHLDRSGALSADQVEAKLSAAVHIAGLVADLAKAASGNSGSVGRPMGKPSR
jgi:hypothetical protein